MSVKLSILTPSIPSRMDRLISLSDTLARQIGDLPVEHLVLIDNKRRTIGEKRQALLDVAIGEYIAFVDDDDEVAPTYVAFILGAMANTPDVITFEQDASFEGVYGRIIFQHGHPNDEWKPNGTAMRGAWHVCAWRRSVARQSGFAHTNYGEDWAFCEPLNRLPLSAVHIPAVLHYYRWSAAVSEANP